MADEAGNAGVRELRVWPNVSIDLAGKQQEGVVASCTKTALAKTSFLSEGVDAGAVPRVVERRVAVNARLPVRGDVGVAARTVVGFRESIEIDPSGHDLRRGRGRGAARNRP